MRITTSGGQKREEVSNVYVHLDLYHKQGTEVHSFGVKGEQPFLYGEA